MHSNLSNSLQIVDTDILGPLPKARNVLAASDYFTSWAEALTDKGLQEAAKFGSALELVDDGRNEMMVPQEMCCCPTT